MSECVIATLILASLSVILVGVIPSTLFGMKTAENRAKAACLGREALEGARRTGFTRVASGALNPQVSNGTQYDMALFVAPLADAVGNPLDAQRIKRVEVQVSWKEHNVREVYTASLLLFRQ